MPYSAVTQPSPEPRLCGGTFSSTEAVHSTLRVAKLDQHRTFGVDGVATGDAHRAQLVCGTLAAANKRGHGRVPKKGWPG